MRKIMKAKFLTILRYIFAIPFAYILSRLVYVIIVVASRLIGLTAYDLHNQGMRFMSNYLTLYTPDNFSLLIWDLILCPALYTYLVHEFAPDHKKVYVIIAILLYSTYCIAAVIAAFMWYDIKTIILVTIGTAACIVAMIITGVINTRK